MSDHTSIEWTDATWNPIGGCTRVDEGCRNCYAEIMAARFSGPGQWGEGLARMVQSGGKTDHRWTGEMRLNTAALHRPLSWRKPRSIFVNSTSDLFHEGVPDAWIDQVFAVMALRPQHTFQVLTKRPERAREYLLGLNCDGARRFNVASQAGRMMEDGDNACDYVASLNWPLPNVWLGTSISDQASANTRIPHLLATPAAVRFLSAEPLLGPVDLTRIDPTIFAAVGNALSGMWNWDGGPNREEWPRLDWIIVGGESGPGARPMHPDWPRSVRDQCVAAGVPFFLKQWGEWGTAYQIMSTGEPVFRAFKDFQNWVHKASTWVNGGVCIDAAGRHCKIGADFMRARDEGTFPVTIMHRVGKKAAGRLLDGQEWSQMPGVA